MDNAKTVAESVRNKFGPDLVTSGEFRDEVNLIVGPDAIVPVCEYLLHEAETKFDLLIALTAIDFWPEEPRFHVVYQLFSTESNISLGLRVPLPGDAPNLPTLETVYPNANWHEREVFDLFGIEFEGHSDQRRIIMPHDWEGHPLRKDYPLGYEEVQFSFNYDDIDRRKKYARD